MNGRGSRIEAPGKAGRDHFVESHAREASWLALVGATVKRGESDRVADLCSKVADEVRGHLAAEEEFLLPKFRALHPIEAAHLDADHDSIRRLLAALQSAALGGSVSLASVAHLLGIVVDHGNRERLIFYPWAQDRFLGSVWVQAVRLLSPAPSPRRAAPGFIGVRGPA